MRPSFFICYTILIRYERKVIHRYYKRHEQACNRVTSRARDQSYKPSVNVFTSNATNEAALS
nr:MAG TPA: hypothetical protein [Caudoviricetes sp.]